MATVEDKVLSTVEHQSSELSTSHAQATAQHEIQSAIVIAQKFPRNEDQCFGALMRSCNRLKFAASAMYSFPRGGKKIEGPSIQMAREAARLWGNIRHGSEIIHDDEKKRTIRAWAWDMQTNARASAEDTFGKLVQRKNKATGTTQWVTPDERDLRELTNKHVSLAKRNCILEILPPDLIEDACIESKAALTKGTRDNVDEARKGMIKAFGEISITPEDLEKHLGHELRLSTPEEIVELRLVYKSIRDGNSRWSDYTGEQDAKPKTTRSELTDKLPPEQSDEKSIADEVADNEAKEGLFDKGQPVD